MTELKRAGIIPYVIEDGEIKMIFMKPSDPEFGGPDFQIAKGQIDPGETALQTAVREGEEEVGLRKENMKGEVSYIGCFMHSIGIYTVQVNSTTDFDDVRFVENTETGDVTWMTVDEFMISGRELHMDAVDAAYNSILNEMWTHE